MDLSSVLQGPKVKLKKYAQIKIDPPLFWMVFKMQSLLDRSLLCLHTFNFLQSGRG